ncbi:MAG: autotransporter-associated beta strand repeat-containing protein, partial [Chthoniobacteraceae bacterium]
PLPSVAANQTNTLIVGLNDQTTQFDGIFQDGYVIQPGIAPVGRFGFVAVDKVGAGVLTLTGTNTNTGTVTVDGGRIDLNNATGNALSTNVIINPGGTVKLLASNQVADANTVTTSGGAFDLNGKNENVGVSLTGGSILDGVGGGALSSNSAFDLQSGTVSAKLSGTSGLNKTTGGTVTLGGAQVHSFSGATNVSAGTLVIASGASVSLSTAVNLTGTGRLFVNGSTAAIVPVSVGGAATLGGTGTVNGTVTVASAGIIEAGQSGSGSLTVDTISFGGPATVNLFNLNTVTASILNVATALTTTAGAGNVVTINLTNSGSLDGTTNYTANGYKLIDVPATFAFGANTNFALGTVTGLGGRSTATLSFVNNDALYMTVAIVNPVWSGAQSSEWSTNLIAGSKNWYLPPSLAATTDYIDLPNPDTVIFNDTATGSTTVDISLANVSPNGVTFDFGITLANYTLQGSKSIIGTTNFVKSGTGTLTINNANSFTGGVVINGGIVKLGNSGALGTSNTLTFGAAAAAGTKLQLFGKDATFTGLSTNVVPGSPVIENGDTVTDSLLTVNLASGTNTFAGLLQNGATKKLGLTKQGGGTLILTGGNTADGGNTVSVGTLQVGNGGTAGLLAGDTNVAGSAVLDFNRSDASTYAGGVTGAGMVSAEGGGTLSITGDVAHSGGTTIAAFTTLQIGNGGATGDLSSAGNITDNGTLAFNRTGSSTVQAPINGTGNVLVGDGVIAGTLILTGNNGYLGTTIINANATLQVGNGAASGSLGAAASITDNGTFAYGRSDAQTYATVFNGTGAIRILSGTLTLSGNNNASYSGGTTIDVGAALIVGNVAGTAGAVPGFNAIGTGNILDNGSLTFRRTGANTWDNQITGTGSLSLTAGTWTFTANNPYNGSTTMSPGVTLTVGTGGTTGSFGNGAVTNPTGLTFNRSNAYALTATNIVSGAGSVTLASSGAVVAAADGQFGVTGALIIGAAAGASPVGNLDLTNGNSSFGALNVLTNNAGNTITVGPGKILTNTGNVTIGYATPLVGNSLAKLTITGGGTYNVTTAAAGVFQVGGGTSATLSETSTLDLTGLTATTINVSATGTVRVAQPTGTNLAGNQSSLLLPTPVAAITPTTPVTTITAANLNIGDNGGNNGSAGQVNSMTLGTGLTTLNVNTVNVGTGARDIGQLSFAAGNGTLILRGAAGGATRATALNIATGGATTGVAAPGNTFADFTGHSADLLVTTLAVGNMARVNNLTSVFSFDTGTLDATNVNVGFRTGTVTTATNLTDIVNIGGGNVTFGNAGGTGTGVDIGNSTYNQAGVATTVGTLNISAGSVTIHNSTTLAAALRLGTNSATGSGTVTATMNVTGGTVTFGGDIIRNPTLNTGTTSTVTLNGTTAVLDMGGHSIGTSGAPVAFSVQQGTLQNLSEFNGGANLVKTTAGTLTLTGSNSYTGATNINAGTVNIDTLAPLGAAQSLGKNIGLNAVTLGTGTSSGKLNYTGLAGTLDKNITALGNGTDTVQNSGTGLLTLSGTLTKNGTTLTLNGGANGIAVTGQIVGAAANSDLTVTNGTTTLSNDNTYKGATTVTSTGTLALATGGSLSGTTGVTVSAGGAVLLNNNANNLVNATTPAPLTVAGGTVALGSTVSADNMKIQTFATLTVSGAATLDMGVGARGNALVFAQNATFTSGTLQVWNWTQGAYTIGLNDAGALNDTQDRFLFNGTGSGFTADQLANIQFFSDGGINPVGFGAAEVTFTGGQLEIVPVPEPATAALLGTVALCALLGCRARRRFPHSREVQ